MHSDILCEDYYDPKPKDEILSEADVSEGRKLYTNYKPQKTMKYFITILLLAIFLFSCGKSYVPKIPATGTDKIVAVYTKNGKKSIDILVRVIQKNVRYDSAAKKDIIVIDTLYGYPQIVAMVDSSGKIILDSLGKPKINPQPQYVEVKKDSVNFHIENISVDSLLKK